MWLITRALIAIVALLSFSVLASLLCWLFFGEGLAQIRTWRRVRHEARFQRDWNPRATAMRGEFSQGSRLRDPVIGRDVISPAQRRNGNGHR